MRTFIFFPVLLICGCVSRAETTLNLNRVKSIVDEDKKEINIDKIGLGNLYFAKNSGMLMCSQGVTGFASIDGLNYVIELGQEKSIADENPNGGCYAIIFITGDNPILVYKYYYKDESVGRTALNEFLK